jgi:phage tail P2-like protein
MSKTIYNVTLLELLPENLRSDPDIIAAGKALDAEYWELTQSIKNVLTFGDIDNAKSEVVDVLAAEMNLDFYDQTLPLANRRALVKNGYLYKYLKGTPFAVKQVVTDIFSAAKTEEWFEYGGEPYYFRVTTETRLPVNEIIERIFVAIDKVKNVRSWLEAFTALKHAGLTVYCGMVIHQRKYQRIGI